MSLGTTVRQLVKGATRRISSAAVNAFGVDGTEEMASATTLVVAPHPDDETFGCGATIARMRSRGADVHVLFLTGGGQSPKPAGMSTTDLIELRRSEAVDALGNLGVDASSIVHLDFEDGFVSQRSDDVADAVSDVLRSTKPDQVLVTSLIDRHPDHAAAARAARTVVPRAGLGTKLYEFPIWQRFPAIGFARSAVRGAGSRPGDTQPRGRPILVPTDPFLLAKQRAIRAYKSQAEHFPQGFIEDFLLPFESFAEIVPQRPQR